MNKHVLRYIVEYIREQGPGPSRLTDMVERGEFLDYFGFSGLLNESDKLAVRQELLDLVELERFVDEHRSKVALAFSGLH